MTSINEEVTNHLHVLLCMLVSRITQKQGLPCLLVEGCGIGRVRTHYNSVSIQMKGRIQELFFHSFFDIIRLRSWISQRIMNGVKFNGGKSDMFRRLMFMRICNLSQIQIKSRCSEFKCRLTKGLLSLGGGFMFILHRLVKPRII